MVEADSQLKLLPAFMLDIYTVCEHFDMLTTVICFKQLYPHYKAQILMFWVTCGVKMMSLCHG